MKIIGNYEIVKNQAGQYWHNITFDKHWRMNEETDKVEQIKQIYRECSKKIKDFDQIKKLIKEYYGGYESEGFNGLEITDDFDLTEDEIKFEIKKLMNFFTEFDFQPNFRFVNTLANICRYQSIRDSINYVKNYFKLTDNSEANAISEKVESDEFINLLNKFHKVNVKKVINSRFKLYYGAAGSGKTTKAVKESNFTMVCHSAMLPSDLMEDFKFEDGKPAFRPSALQIAMTEGKIICLDEINLLPFESLRFLQSILDGKKEFEYKGKTIEIKDGFEVIGTMNLSINGQIYGLPEPLVDRAFELKEFVLNEEDLLGALI